MITDTKASDESRVEHPEVELARRQFAALQRFSSALSHSRTVNDAVRAAIEEGHAFFAAAASVGYVIAPDGQRLTLIGSGGLSADDASMWSDVPIDGPILVAKAIRERRALWYGSREQVLEDFPSLASSAHPAARTGSACALPLVVNGRTVGGLGMVFSDPRTFDQREPELAQMLTDQCTVAISRALAFEAEVAARRDLERQRKALSVLAAVGDLLADNLNFDDALQRLARMVVPILGDWCAIDVVAKGRLVRKAVHHPDPGKLAVAEEIQRRWPTPADAPRGAPLVLRTGQADRGIVTDELLAQVATDADQLRLTRELGLREFLVVPLAAGRSILGALTVVFGESDRHYDDETSALVREVGRRAAGYLERARLLREAEVAREQLTRLFTGAPAAICITQGPAHRFVLANSSYQALIGFDPVGKTVVEALPELETQQHILRLLDRVVHGGETIVGDEVPVRIRRAADGVPEERWFNFVYQPLREPDDTISGVVVFAFDVSDQVGARQRIERLADEVRRNEARFRAVVETTMAIVWTATPTGEVVEISPSWLAFTGQTAAAYVNGGFMDAIHPDDRERTLAIWATATTAGAPYAAEYRLRRADGTWAETIARGAPVRDASDAIVEYAGCNIDVTERNRIERALREHVETLSILNGVGPLIAAELDHDKLVQAITDAATRLSGAKFGAFFYNVVNDDGGAYMLYAISGVPREAFSRFPMPRNTKVFAPTFAGEGIVRVDDITQDPRYGQNAPYHGMPPGHLPVRSYLAVPVQSRGGKAIGGLFFGHPDPGVFDARVETLVAGLAAQAAVSMDNAALYRHAQQLIKALERSNAELDQFAYVASHDLKAPLRGIANLSQWIEEDAGAALGPEARQQLDLLRGRVRRMEALIDGILNYSRAGRKRWAVERVDPRRLIGDIVDLLAVKPPATVEIAEGFPEAIHVERTPLQQVLLNLISNALKHARRPDVRIVVSACERDEWLELSVADDGPGIAPEFHERVWGIFQTLEARDTVEGTGIGLAVVKKIVESRGGTVALESAEGLGATFRFTWPRTEKGPPS